MTARIDPAAPPICNKEGLRADGLLAPWTYRCEEFFALEIERLFKRRWLLAAHVSDVSEAGDYVTFEAFGESALVVRGSDGRVRAFHNVCRHRGARLVDGARGRCGAWLTCPFHGWSYDLDGALVSVPAADTFAGLDFAQHGLAALPMEIWMGFVFVRFGDGGDGGETDSVAQTMKPVEALLAPYRLSEMTPLSRAHFHEVRAYNWKTIHDIDNEGYHVPAGHPALRQLYGKDYRDELYAHIPVSFAALNDKPARLWSVRHYQKLLPDFAHLPAEHRRLWLYVGVFPNLVLALYPDCMEFYMTIPLSPEATRFVGGGYALPDERRSARAARYLNARINRMTDREDEAFVRRLRDGMRSSAFPTVRLSSLEQGVLEFHQKIGRALPVGHLTEAPPPGTVARVNAEMGGDSAATSA